MGLGERAGRLKAVSVFATDGAVWTVVLDDTSQPSGGHLARISATDGYQLVATDPVACGGSAGPDGSVWVIQNGEVVRYLPDGTRASAGLPERLDPVSDEYIPEVANGVCLHGVDPTGVVWVSEFVDVEGEECTAGDVAPLGRTAVDHRRSARPVRLRPPEGRGQ